MGMIRTRKEMGMEKEQYKGAERKEERKEGSKDCK
jgi:hypothetical protein